MNPFVDGSGKVGIFDEARGFAWVVVETFTFSGGLDPAVVHLKDDGSRFFVHDGLDIDLCIKAKIEGLLQPFDAGVFG